MPDLMALSPSEEGWKVEDLPLGDTESLNTTALKMLRMDGFIQRRYTRGADELTLYVAYWKPGTMDTRLVASHTPDRCWVENGWSCPLLRNAQTLEMPEMEVQPAQYRVFRMNGRDVTVYYWLMVNGERYEFGDRMNRYPNPLMFIRDFIREMARGRPEHYFVRISSNMDAERLRRLPLFIETMKGLEKTGISKAAD